MTRRIQHFLLLGLLLLSPPAEAGDESTEGQPRESLPLKTDVRGPTQQQLPGEGGTTGEADGGRQQEVPAEPLPPPPYDSGIDLADLRVRGRFTVKCKEELLPGQYRCFDPVVDPETQQPLGCRKIDDDLAVAPNAIPCQALPGLLCSETGNSNFTLDSECQWTNGYDFETAVILSVFLGCFGADRFYLGYPALGLLKFSTLGFFFLGHLIDIVLISSQTVGPADGSAYVISYFGPGVKVVSINDETARRPQPDWYN